MAIKLKNVSKIFINGKNKQKYYAANKINLDIPTGKLVTLLGPSGCGKSTILYMIAGLMNVSEGKIFFDDKDVTNLPPEKRGIGLVFQNYSLYPHMTVRQNIMFPLQNMKMPISEIQKEVERISVLCSIEEYLDKKPSESSGGQQQRVALARALIKKSKILLLDEPLSNLDTRLRLKMREEIRRIQQKTKITAILVTHDHEEAMSISDYIYVMNKGCIQQSNVPKKIYDEPNNLFVASFLGVPFISVFNGKILNGKIYIGDSIIFSNKKFKNLEFKNNNVIKEVYVAIRPEGYVLSENGVLEVEAITTENIGRELILLARNINSVHKNFQIIIPNHISSLLNFEKVKKNKFRFNILENKLFIFDKINGNRIV
ncbi:ATP-binding cassette domain-containing protein [Texas Phoenix palm phytoplasma]|uniref:ATP-binding cassette domain-containing protein n=1 Tax=Texas Phoenix palm phytoplasma TaxID=176709 RepID=A0ABS5BIC1_9MOLU|nr:ABC transporter ATP-binding protein [Texas Phoenix palm phytoplasma]MBP3059335.1 ATP-binding cassette domain-containing protein [Texas Phoenix palm phytoplasma]